MNTNTQMLLPKIAPEVYTLDNGIKLYCFRDSEIAFIRMELYFKYAGTNNQDVIFSSLATNDLITEGTKSMSAKALADKVDYYGAFIEKSLERDAANVDFYFLKKYQDSLLPLFYQIITEASFSDSELELYRQKLTQQYLLNQQKTDHLAKVRFNQLLFGAEHPYGKAGKKEDIVNLRREDIVAFYNSFYSLKQENCCIIASGDIDNNFVGKVNSLFGKTINSDKQKQISLKDLSLNKEISFCGKSDIVHLTSARQASLRMGTLTIGVKHKDYMLLNLLNSLFGGYFSSRLMSNIREEKGYTYGIGSYLIPCSDFSTFAIVSDIKQENAQEAKEEIFKELDNLLTMPIEEEELQRVKNYTKGELLRGLDGGFDIAERFVSLLKFGFENNYYEDYMAAIDAASAEELQHTAQKYLNKEKMLTVLATK